MFFFHESANNWEGELNSVKFTITKLDFQINKLDSRAIYIYTNLVIQTIFIEFLILYVY